MKKLFTLILALAFGFGLKAQCPLTQAVDFTATDVHGTEVHLFDILDGGQAVLIDFFFTTCGPCQQATPKIVESYYAMGCNMHDVFYMEIATGDSDAACLNWVNTYGVEYPTISGQAGGTGICSQYGIGQYPTVILIMPDHQIVIQDLWPINNAQTVINQLEAHGLQQHDCNGTSTCEAPTDLVTSFETHVLTEDDFPTINLSWTASETAQSYNVYRNGELIANVNETNYSDDHGILGLNEYCYTITSVCEDDLESDVSNESCIVPEYVEISPLDTLYFESGIVSKYFGDLEVINFTTQDLEFGEFTSDEFEIQLFDWDYEENLTQGFTLQSNDTKIIIFDYLWPIGDEKDQVYTGHMRVATTVGDFDWYIIYYSYENIDETHQPSLISIFPNPANDFVTLKGESLGMVSIYNALGQKVDEFESNDTEIRINTAGYENGIYVVKVGEKALRFVVKH